jgi:elongation factor G
MKLEVTAPSEFQGNIMGQLNRRMALIQSNEVADDGTGVTITAEVPLAQMFGYSTDLRSITQGKGEFTMEYRSHAPVTRDVQETLIKKYKEQQAAEAAAK